MRFWPWHYVHVKAAAIPLENGNWQVTVNCGPTRWGPFWWPPTPREIEKARGVAKLIVEHLEAVGSGFYGSAVFRSRREDR